MKTISLPIRNQTLHIADTSLSETLSWIDSHYAQPGFTRLLTLNPEILMSGIQTPDIAALIASADLTIPDGTGIVACVRLALQTKIQRVTGSDLAPALIASGKYRIYLLGSTPEIVEKAASEACLRQAPEANDKFQRAKPFETHNPPVYSASLNKQGCICGYHHGFWTDAEWPQIAENIANATPDIVLVGMGFPRQEYILEKLKKTLPHGIGIGVGGVIDMLAGVQKRAPLWTQKLHIEWLYRALKQPSRLGRLRWIAGFARYTMWLWWRHRHV